MRGIIAACALALCCVGEMIEGAESPPPLARYFPQRDLVVYAEFDGLDGHAGAWQQTAAAKILHETATGAMLEAVASQVLDRVVPADARVKFSGKDAVGLAQNAFRRGFAFGINRRSTTERPRCVGLVLRGAAKGEYRALVDRLIDAGNAPATQTETVLKPGGRKVVVVTEGRALAFGRGPTEPRGFAWWVEGDDLAFSLVLPSGADALIAALEHAEPNAIEHPTRTALARVEGTFQPIGVAFFDMAALPPLPPSGSLLGMDRVKRFEYRWGCDGPALMTVARIVVPAPRTGALGLLDQPAFDTRKLPPLPAALDGFTVFSIAPGPTFERFLHLAAGSVNPDAADIRAFEKRLDTLMGHDVRAEILDRLGPLAVAYNVPSRISAPTNALEGLALGFAHVPRASVAIQADDVKTLGLVLDDLVQRFNRAMQPPPGAARRAEFRPLRGDIHGYVLSVAPSVLPLPAGMRPTFVLGKGSLIVASTPAAARDALAMETKQGGLTRGDVLAPALAHVPPHATFLAVSDTRNSLLPELVANIPALVELVGDRQALSARFMRFVPLNHAESTPHAAFRLEIDPDVIPAPDDLRPFLFPATFAINADDDAISLVTREAFPAFSPTTAAPIAVALALSTLPARRLAIRHAQSINNLKQIGLALHNFHDANGHFPAAIRDKGGKPLLSWRVAILPFLEQQPLFGEFHLDEPWDSPHNKELLERMPAVYSIPGASVDPGQTFYRSFAGKGTFLDPDQPNGISMVGITDGTSNTIAVVEARTDVPWTKPDSDIPFDPDHPDRLLELLGGHSPREFAALFCDGAVKLLKESIRPETLRAVITRNGGEVVSGGSF